MEPAELKAGFTSFSSLHMEGKITWISEPKQNHRKEYFLIVGFEMLGGAVFKTTVYLVQSYRNFANWEQLLVKGNIIGGLRYVRGRKGVIDADSPVYLVKGSLVGEKA